MTRDDFVRYKFQAFEAIDCRHPRREGVVYKCMLLAIDYEQELMKLEPIDKEMYEDYSFWARIEYCERPRPKLKIKK